MECSDGLNHLIAGLPGIALNLEYLDVYRHPSLQTFLDRSLYTLFGQLPHIRTLRGLKSLDSKCEPASENTISYLSSRHMPEFTDNKLVCTGLGLECNNGAKWISCNMVASQNAVKWSGTQ